MIRLHLLLARCTSETRVSGEANVEQNTAQDKTGYRKPRTQAAEDDQAQSRCFVADLLWPVQILMYSLID